MSLNLGLEMAVQTEAFSGFPQTLKAKARIRSRTNSVALNSLQTDNS